MTKIVLKMDMIKALNYLHKTSGKFKVIGADYCEYFLKKDVYKIYDGKEIIAELHPVLYSRDWSVEVIEREVAPLDVFMANPDLYFNHDSSFMYFEQFNYDDTCKQLGIGIINLLNPNDNAIISYLKHKDKFKDSYEVYYKEDIEEYIKIAKKQSIITTFDNTEQSEEAFKKFHEVVLDTTITI